MKVNNAMKSWVRRWTTDTMTKLGYPELGKSIDIFWKPLHLKVGLSEWNVHRNIRSGKKIKVSDLKLSFSQALWPYIPRDERYETVVHECCHIVDAIENPMDDPEEHNENWTNLMRRLGRFGGIEMRMEKVELPDEVLVIKRQKEINLLSKKKF